MIAKLTDWHKVTLKKKDIYQGQVVKSTIIEVNFGLVWIWFQVNRCLTEIVPMDGGIQANYLGMLPFYTT